jgi:hypothetical protein
MSPIKIALSKSAGSVALKITIIVAAAIGGAGMVSSNVFASLSATATNTTGGSVTSGTLKLILAPSNVVGITGGFTAPISSMAPGDTVNRYIDLKNDGSLDGLSPTLLITTSDTSTLTSDGTKGLQVTISACGIAWTNGGVCNDTTTAVMIVTPVSTLKAGAVNITLPLLNAGLTNYLKVSTALPAATENVLNGVLPGGTVQGLSATLTWAFTIQQRNGATSDS